MRNVNEDFNFDLSLSHKTQDRTVVRQLAERLRTNSQRSLL